MKLYNTETKTKSEFKPIDPEHVTMYVCGPTVYNYCHIGNFRPPVVFDVLARVLRAKFTRVTYARNITDIDDKINAAAKEQGVAISAITEKFTQAYHDDLEVLGVQKTDIEPKVTEHVADIHAEIQSLIDRGHAYEAQGHVLFRVDSYEGYGELSKRDPDELLAGARVDVAAYKENPGDFVLWKPSSADQPGWDSPWGRGRPGWHIECTAMAAKHLGDTIDIHGGGNDLIFPHHENERAQSTCSHGTKFVNYWLHNGLINMNQEKMSKSLGNVLLLKDLAKEMPGEVIRYILLSAHYRAPLDWSDDAVIQAKASLERLYGALRKLKDVELPEDIESHITDEFDAAMSDDLNTPKALAELFALAKKANTAEDHADKVALKASLLHCGYWLGLLQNDPEEWFSGGTSDDFTAEIESLIEQRAEAKQNKDWARADEIRAELVAKGVILEDGAEGTTWRIEN